MSTNDVSHANPLASKRVLVFGGSAGIGFGVASGALANGSAVHISSSNAERVAAAVSKLQGLYPGATVSGSVADLSSQAAIEAGVKSVLDSAVARLGGAALDHVVYTAGGLAPPTKLAEVTGANAYDSFSMRYLAPLMIAKHIAANPGKYVKPGRESSVTATSGVLLVKPLPGMATSLPGGGALQMLFRCLSIDLAPIRFNIVQPGAIQTDLLNKLGEENIRKWSEGSVLKVAGTPAECAETYLYAMRCAFVTGQNLLVDGGFTLT